METQAELVHRLDENTATVNKVRTEQARRFDALTEQVKQLQDLLAQGGVIGPAVNAASDRLTDALRDLDAVVPDETPTVRR